jgi:putative PIN family toxin of toxin-antitoxin system
MIRAVLDTNVLVSAVIRRDGKPSQVISRAVVEYSWLTSEYILTETAEVFARKHIQRRYGKWLTPDVQTQFLATARAMVEFVEVHTTLTAVPADVKDNPVLACAVDGRADYLVTGDPDLLSLDAFQGIQIVTPNRFLEILDTLSAEEQTSE